MSAVTAFQRVAAAYGTAFKAAPALASGNVAANPTRPWAREVAQAVAVRLAGAQRSADGACADEWQLTLEVDCEARAISGTDDPADAVDALLSAVADRIAAADLSALGVSMVMPEMAVAWQFDAADTPLALATLRFTVQLYTAQDRLTPSTP
jgi:hypothetical protein